MQESMYIIYIIYLVIIVAISIGLHEYAHARASYSFGDPTPKLQGRLTPNPIAHIDPIGFLMIFLVHFGRGKPVEINPVYYKNRFRDELIVALAGPFTNIMLAILGIVFTLLTHKYLQDKGELIEIFWMLFAQVNIALAVFNMLPIPPLDGFRIVKFLNPRLGIKIEQYSLQISLALFTLIIIENNLNIGFIGKFISIVSSFLFNIISAIIGQII